MLAVTLTTEFESLKFQGNASAPPEYTFSLKSGFLWLVGSWHLQAGCVEAIYDFGGNGTLSVGFAPKLARAELKYIYRNRCVKAFLWHNVWLDAKCAALNIYIPLMYLEPPRLSY